MSTGAFLQRVMRPAAAGLLGLACVGVALAGPAQAVGDQLYVSPASGSSRGFPVLTTAGPCPFDADLYVGLLFGPGLPADGQLAVVPSSFGMSKSGPFAVEMSWGFTDVASDAGLAQLSGRYALELRCTDALSALKQTYRAEVDFPTPQAFQAVGAAAGPAPTPVSSAVPPSSPVTPAAAPTSPPSAGDGSATAPPPTGGAVTTPAPSEAPPAQGEATDGLGVAGADEVAQVQSGESSRAPVVVGGLLAVLAVILGVVALRRPRTARGTPSEDAEPGAGPEPAEVDA
jgi:hypothetical protein